ncbi:MAG: hypothetical protein LKJ76_04810 [Lachnospiraceae bacterium]|jgi:hypothetical protein|nr:hypothetical protein [Lachnospiraceae bacterium]
MTNTINIQIIEMKQDEAVTENEDGSYTVFISDSLSPDARVAAYNHAIYHIDHDDFEKEDVQLVELAARGKETKAEIDPHEEWYQRMYQSAISRRKKAHSALDAYDKKRAQFEKKWHISYPLKGENQ